MYHRRGGVRKSALKDYQKRSTRRGVSLRTRVKYQRPTARNQKHQIDALARTVARNSRYIRSQKVFTDYQWGDAATPLPGISQNLTSGQWFGYGLTNFERWIPCLRRDTNVAESSKTFCIRSTLNLRVNVGDVSQLAYINVFLVSPRRDAVDAVALSPPPIGAMTQLVLDNDYIENSQNQGANVRLNPAKFKVHAAKYITLTPNAPSEALPQGSAVGNPFATWRKWQWNCPLKFSVRMPVGKPWPSLSFDDMAYYQKYYLLLYSTSLGGAGNGPRFDATVLSTCINFS